MNIQELRKLAKERGINSFQKSARELENELFPKKRGAVSWKPARRLDVRNKDENFRYHWADKKNVDKKQYEGWEVAPSEEHADPNLIDGGKSIDSTTSFRELILMRMPEELAQERDAWVAERTRSQTAGLKHTLEHDLRNTSGTSAPVDGKITIIE